MGIRIWELGISLCGQPERGMVPREEEDGKLGVDRAGVFGYDTRAC